MNNKRKGNKFEAELCQLLYSHGFWAHNMAQNAAGQPFDILAARNGISIPIDAKVCDNDVFSFSRVEENQRSAMELWKATGNVGGYFALRLSDGAIYMLDYQEIKLLEQERVKYLTKKEHFGISYYAAPFEEWVKAWS